MKREQYLNVILTINALLLASLIWTQVADQPVLATTVEAQSARNPPVRVPNAAEQRKRIADEILSLKKTLEATQKMLETTTLKVEVTNLDQMGG
jgi:hypothetical protein